MLNKGLVNPAFLYIPVGGLNPFDAFYHHGFCSIFPSSFCVQFLRIIVIKTKKRDDVKTLKGTV